MLLTSAVVEGDPGAAASEAALRHGTDERPESSRRRRGQTFRYLLDHDRRVRHRATLSRVGALVRDLEAHRGRRRA